jgi:phosphatidylglycerophosphatase A
VSAAIRPRGAAALVASGFGAGYAPVAPGTVGSLLAVVLGLGLLRLSPAALAIGCVAAALGGTWAIARADAAGDPGWVVIDEVAGQWLAMLGLGHASLVGGVAAFLLFRLFDIAKPGPVGWADRQHGPVGVMADDLIAGAMAAVILLLGRWALASWAPASWALASWAPGLAQGWGG